MLLMMRLIGQGWRTVLFVVVVQAVCSCQTFTLPNGGLLIGPQDLLPPLTASLKAMGARMQTANKAQITLLGVVTDATGSRPAQITVQAPGYLAYREGTNRSVTFDGTSFKTKSGQLSTSDQAVAESLLANTPDDVFLQLAFGGGLRRVGSHFRNDNVKNKTYLGPSWTVFAFSPKPRQGIAQGTALQQSIFIAIDERTGLMADVRTVVKRSPTVQNVLQTQFSNWIQQADQWFPGTIVRLENARQTLSFQTQQATYGPALPISTFQP